MLKILHLSRWAGIHTYNVDALKEYSRHRHEFVADTQHAYPEIDYSRKNKLTSATTTRDQVLELVEWADVLHFHGFAPGRVNIHGIDWNQFRGKKLFSIHAICSYPLSVAADCGWTVRPAPIDFDVPFIETYDLILGPHLSCRRAYRTDRLEYVPDIIPIFDELYTPLEGAKRGPVKTYKASDGMMFRCQLAGIELSCDPTPSSHRENMAFRRANCRAVWDNATDGHWGLAGFEALSQGIPAAAWIHPLNLECFRILGVSAPPFEMAQPGGSDVVQVLSRMLAWPEDEWRAHSEEARCWILRSYSPERLVKRWDEVFGQLEARGRI